MTARDAVPHRDRHARLAQHPDVVLGVPEHRELGDVEAQRRAQLPDRDAPCRSRGRRPRGSAGGRRRRAPRRAAPPATRRSARRSASVTAIAMSLYGVGAPSGNPGSTAAARRSAPPPRPPPRPARPRASRRARTSRSPRRATRPCASTSTAASRSSGVPPSGSIASPASRNVSAPLNPIAGPSSSSSRRYADHRPRAPPGREHDPQPRGARPRDGGGRDRRDPVRRIEQRPVDVEDDAPKLSLLVRCWLHLVLTGPVVGWKMAQAGDPSILEVGVARLKIAYIGGGSTRGAGTMASFIEQGENFDGSEIVLIDLDAERLELIRTLADRMAKAKGVDITVTATTDRRAGLDACDAILTSYRPGGFEARVLDERIPLDHGVVGQETQGPGGFFMALRSIAVMQGILDDVAVACPGARIFNYTNPVNIVAQAVTRPLRRPVRVALRGPDRLPGGDRRGRRPRPGEARRRQRRPQPRLVERPPHLRRQRPPPAGPGGLRAPRARPRAAPADPPHAAPRVRHGLAAERVLPVLLLRGRGPGGDDLQADDARRGHPRLGARLLGPLRRAGAQRRPAARPRPLARRDPRARAGDRLHGRRLQRPRRDAARQRAEPGLDPRLPRHARGRDARRVRRERHPPARAARPADAPARPRRGARRVPAGGRRRRLVGRHAGRDPRARRPPARPLGRPRRAALRRAGRRAPRSTCPTRLVPA